MYVSFFFFLSKPWQTKLAPNIHKNITENRKHLNQVQLKPLTTGHLKSTGRDIYMFDLLENRPHQCLDKYLAALCKKETREQDMSTPPCYDMQ